MTILSSNRASLAHITLLKMAVRVTIVVLLMTLASYWHLVSRMENEVVEQLQKYIDERDQRENNAFTLIKSYHDIFKKEFINRYQSMLNQDPIKQFNELFVDWGDGTTRLRADEYHGRKKENGKLMIGMGAFIGKSTVITPAIRRIAIIAYDMLSSYGVVWYNRSQHFYVSTPDNFVITYWPEVPWTVEFVTPDYDITKEEWVYIADLKHNPRRETQWTGLYYDDVAKDWMVSCITPIDINGKYLASVGNDLMLNELFDRTINNHLEGTYNFIFREDGRLVVHANYMEEIKKTLGEFYIPQSGDDHLKRIFTLVKQAGLETTGVFENTEDSEYIAVSKIQGPNWYFVTIYPQALLSKAAFNTVIFILGLGILSLAIELILLYLIIKYQVVSPLQKLLTATQQLANGQFWQGEIQHLPLTRNDEIGQLANSFAQMAKKLQQLFEKLEEKNKSLQENESRLLTLFNSANDAILIIEGDKFIDCNPKALEIFGCERDYIIGKPPYILSPPLQMDGQESTKKAFYLIGAVLEGKPQFFEWIHQRGNGTLFTAEISLNKVDLIGKVYVQVIIRDVTERKQAEADRFRLAQEQEAKNAALRYSQAIEAKNAELVRLNQEKNEFLSITAHDLKNPLSGILGLAEEIYESANVISKEDLLEYSKMIQASSKQMFDLITNLLDVNAIESGKINLVLEKIDLLPVVQRSVQNYAERAKNKQIVIRCDFTEVAYFAEVDKNMIYQVLDNLLSNAIKYSPFQKNVYIRLIQEPNNLLCEVEDEGPGLTATDQKKLFGKFTRLSTKPTGGEHSTGLGLFIVKKLIEIMSGEVWCESEVGKGTKFTVRLRQI